MPPFNVALANLTRDLRQYVRTRPIALQNMYLAQLLPPRRSTESEIKRGRFRIQTTPAPITAVDSPYAKVANIQMITFEGSTFKITAEAKLSEANQDQMHAQAQSAIVRAYQEGGSPDLVSVYQNFIGEVMEDGVMLSLDYGEEQARAITLAYGKMQVIDSNTGNAVDLVWDIPAEHKTNHTIASGEAYHLAGSKFWDDVALARDRLNVEPVGITDPTTWAAILNNPAHGIIADEPVQLGPQVWAYRIAQGAKTYKSDGSFEYNLSQRGLDYRRSGRIIVYGVKPDDATSPYLWPKGRVTYLRQTNRQTTLIDGQIVQGALGVTHIGPNTESGQQPERFGKIYIPEGAEWEVIAKGSQDMMTDIEEPRNLVLCRTEMPA
ncbi:hypothetical protein ACFFLM_04435 [Deinococcus oregonensis]|uniref:Major capsid protein n=1 Tax=Deinococcus oregonensis TaxID=1805970 RepID=A0ABV6AUP4_9DEIO